MRSSTTLTNFVKRDCCNENILRFLKQLFPVVRHFKELTLYKYTQLT